MLPPVYWQRFQTAFSYIRRKYFFFHKNLSRMNGLAHIRKRIICNRLMESRRNDSIGIGIRMV